MKSQIHRKGEKNEKAILSLTHRSIPPSQHLNGTRINTDEGRLRGSYCELSCGSRSLYNFVSAGSGTSMTWILIRKRICTEGLCTFSCWFEAWFREIRLKSITTSIQTFTTSPRSRLSSRSVDATFTRSPCQSVSSVSHSGRERR